MSIKSGAKTKHQGVAGWKVGQTWHRDNCSHAKKYNKNIETLPTKRKANFFPPYLRQAAKIYVATSHSVVRQETIEISEQRTAFVWLFAQEVNWCLKDCDKQRLQTTVSINLWKIFPGHPGDWFDVKNASISTTELWDALKSFILTNLKIKVAPYPIIVSLDTLIRISPNFLERNNNFVERKIYENRLTTTFFTACKSFAFRLGMQQIRLA